MDSNARMATDRLSVICWSPSHDADLSSVLLVETTSTPSAGAQSAFLHDQAAAYPATCRSDQISCMLSFLGGLQPLRAGGAALPALAAMQGPDPVK